MSEQQQRVVLSVLAKGADEQSVVDYISWLERQHMPDVLKLGKALSAQLCRLHNHKEGFQVEGRYVFASSADLEHYQQVHAPSLRQQAQELFPHNEYRRSVALLHAELSSVSISSKAELYATLDQQVRACLSENMPWQARISTVVALIKQQLHYVSWVGFYQAIDQELWVAAYQGPLACVHIPFGKGVCGHVAQTQRIQVVEDVTAFPGHIACDALTRSEIVLPVFRQGSLAGVLDLDSHQVAAFDAEDVAGLSRVLAHFRA